MNSPDACRPVGARAGFLLWVLAEGKSLPLPPALPGRGRRRGGRHCIGNFFANQAIFVIGSGFLQGFYWPPAASGLE
ncbi:hypothetical protein [Solimonas fluminis]|uniref:hypothetical protein n=1 Tax=Solimonas fluminis TaxID=2086571 RepID=UPI0010575503|nr:hypothetical protein [Solimonas fluminis]